MSLLVATAVVILSGTGAFAQDSALKPPLANQPHQHLGTPLIPTLGDSGDLPGAACGSSAALDTILRGRHRLAQAAFERSRALADGLDAPGDVRERDGIWIIEADELILLRDNPIDLEGRTLRYLPAAGGYDLSLIDEAYDATLGTLVLDDPDTASAAQVDLVNFTFPISDASYSTLWVDRALAIRTSDPATAPAAVGGGNHQYGKFSTALGANLLLDGDDRLSPAFHIATGTRARFIWVKDQPDKVLITWRRLASDGDEEFYFDIQAALFPDGGVEFTYHALRGYVNGAPLIYFDVADWLGAFVPQGSVSDPDDGFYAPVEILNLEVLDDPASDMMRMRLTLDAVLPETADPSATYYLDLKDGTDDTLYYRFYFYVGASGRTGLWLFTASTNAWTSVGIGTATGDTWEIFASLTDLPDLNPASIRYYAYTHENDELRDELILDASSDGGPTFARDYTAEAPFNSTIPIVEPFLYPEFNTWGVKQRLLQHTGWDETKIDGIPMYQAFYTELSFYAGAYNTGGNCGAANMGMCDSTQPLSPSLLHMSKTNNGWNRIDQDHRFTVISHEQGHHWLQRVQIDEGSGPSNVLNPQSAHPAAYVHTEAETVLHAADDSSVMGGGFWIDNADGTFTTPAARTYYSYASYELYLMGLMAPEEVNNWFYLDNTDPAQPLSYYPATDVTVTGDRHDVDINMMISAMGTRSPVYPDAKRDFFTPLVLVVRAGEEPSTADWDFMMSLRHPWREAFATQTTSRGTVTTVSPREISPPGGSPQLRVEKLEGDELRFAFEDPDFSDQVRYNLYEDALGAGFGGWAANRCAVVPGNSGADLYLDATPASPLSAFFLLTMSNLAFEGEAGDDSSGVERTTTQARCGGW